MTIFEEITKALQGPRGVKPNFSWVPSSTPSPAAPTANRVTCLCPNCKTDLDSIHANGSSAKPKKGDFSICTECGEILVFQSEFTLDIPSFSDWAALSKKPTTEKAIWAARDVILKAKS